MIRRDFLKISGLFYVPLSEGLRSKLLLIGDSLAFGISKHLKYALSKHQIVLLTNAIGGSSTHQWARKNWLINSLRKYEPNNVLVILGTNDSGVPSSRQQFPKNSKKIVDTCHKYGVENVVWATPPKIKINTNFIYEGMVYADVLLDYRNLVIGLERDLIHPTIKGHKIWASHIVKDLSEAYPV